MFERRNYVTRPFATKMQKDYARLAEVWQREKARRKAEGLPPLLQKDLAHKHGVTEAMVGHYLKGREPLNLKWKVWFAEFLETPPWEIWPDFEHKQILSSGLPPDAIEVALDYAEITPGGQEAVRKMMAELPRRQPAKRDTK